MAKKPGIHKAINRLGGATALARAINEHKPKKPCSRQLVEHWQNKGSPSPHWVILIEKASGIPRHELRPDIYPDPASE
jgi:DNA-binding transcriptional regulator YdaS (Cro superfamily)